MKKLINMKLDRKAREASTAAEVKPEGPRYPWGLSLTLDNEALDKLGLALPDVGTKFTVMAQANVTGISSSEREKEKNRSVSLQITDMALEAASSKKSNADALFGGAAK